MSTIDYIKKEIKRLYDTNPGIHVCVKMSRPKRTVDTTPVVIKSVYPNFFCVEETSKGYRQCHSVQYAEVLTGQVNISELKPFAEKG